MNSKIHTRGFTLIEILIVIGLIAVLSGIVLVAINPARQFAQGRDAQRMSNLNAILNAVGQKMADNKGVFEVGCPQLPSSTTTIGTDAGLLDLSCLVPLYLPALPADPLNGTSVDTEYHIRKDTNGRVWVAASTPEPSIPRNTDLYIMR